MERDGRGIPSDQQRRASRRVATQANTNDTDTPSTRHTYTHRQHTPNDDSGLSRYNTKKSKSATNITQYHNTNNSNIDFQRMEMRSLLRYKRFFKLPVKPNATKYELIDAVQRHFARPLLTLPNKDLTGAQLNNNLIQYSVSHEHTGSIMANNQQLTEPDILAAFLHVTHRFVKLRQQQRMQLNSQ